MNIIIRNATLPLRGSALTPAFYREREVTYQKDVRRLTRTNTHISLLQQF